MVEAESSSPSRLPGLLSLCLLFISCGLTRLSACLTSEVLKVAIDAHEVVLKCLSALLVECTAAQPVGSVNALIHYITMTDLLIFCVFSQVAQTGAIRRDKGTGKGKCLWCSSATLI